MIPSSSFSIVNCQRNLSSFIFWFLCHRFVSFHLFFFSVAYLFPYLNIDILDFFLIFSEFSIFCAPSPILVWLFRKILRFIISYIKHLQDNRMVPLFLH